MSGTRVARQKLGGRERPLRKAAWFAALMFAGSVTLGSAHAQEAEHPDGQLPTPAKSSHKKRRHGKAILSGRLATPDEIRDEPLDKPSGHIQLYAGNFGA